MKKHLVTALAALGAAFILYIGLGYLLAPQAMAAGFGLPDWPTDQGTGFLAVKGVRDLGFGLMTVALLITGQRRALGWAFLATSAIPFGDMLVVLTRHGSTVTALSVHGLTALAVLVTGVLLIRERPAAGRSDRSVRSDRPARSDRPVRAGRSGAGRASA